MLWWRQRESNSWPPACKAGALANWAMPPYSTLKNKQHNKYKHILLRKEVIQPHLPIRLPCYDFTLIIDSTFDCCLHKWLAHRLRVSPTLMVWRAVCTRPGNVFTTVCWPVITSNSSFMKANFSLQSELRLFFGFCSISLSCFPLL